MSSNPNPYESPRAAGGYSWDDRSNWPALVKVALWGVPNRTAAWAFVWFSLVTAAGCIAYGFVDWRFFLGGLFAISGLWYYLALRWVDQVVGVPAEANRQP